MSKEATAQALIGNTNMTIDVQSGANVILTTTDENGEKIFLRAKEYGCKIERVHIYTPLQFKSSCNIGNRKVRYDCEVHPELDSENSISTYPKTLSEADKAWFESCVQARSVEFASNNHLDFQVTQVFVDEKDKKDREYTIKAILR